MTAYEYIATADELSRYLDRSAANALSAGSSAGGPNLAMDIEAELNLHVYGERFCLLQVYDGTHPAVVDPTTVSIESIKAVLEDSRIQKVLYDAASDRALLYKTHRILMRGVVDLKPAVELLEFEKQGLDSVLTAVLGVEPPASKRKFQQYNWTRRPIHRDAIEYALRDVLYLFDLRDALFARLEEAGKTGEYLAENAKRDEIVPDVDRKPGFLRSRRVERLTAGRRRELERLWAIREGYAERLDVPPNMVVANNDLLAIAAGKAALESLRAGGRVPRKLFEEMMEEMRKGSSGDG